MAIIPFLNNATFAGDVALTGGSLSISGDGSNAVTFTESGNGDFTIDAPDDIRLDAGGGDLVLKAAGTEFGRISKSSNDLSITSSVTNSDILLMPNGTGNVGIGTASPIAKLHVASDSTLGVQGTVLKVENTSNTGSSQDIHIYNQYDRDIGIKFETLGGTNYIWQDSNGDDALIFTAGGNSRTTDSTLILEQDHDASFPNGSLGVGLTNPAVPLHVNGFARFNGGLQLDGANRNILAIDNTSLGLGTNNIERMTITNVGGISFGSTGTAYGTSGQVLTSAGNASPTWTTPTTGTVTGTGAATQVAFWDGTSSLSGNSNLYWDNTNKHLGIGDTTPGSRLKVTSGTSETSIYTVDILHIRNNPDVATNAVRINMDLSGADNTTADRTNSGLYLDIDSSADGDAANEHRLFGVYSDVRFTGFSDQVRGGSFYAESNNTTQKTGQLVGVYGNAVHDSNSTSGGVSNMYGVFGISSIQDLGDVDNAFGGYFSVIIGTNRGAADVGITKGVEGKITIDKDVAINYSTMTGMSSIIDNNEGAVPNFGTQYLFKGDYQGDRGANAWGIYTEGDKNYFEGDVGIGVTNPQSKLQVDGGIQMSDDTDTAVAGKVGTVRYRTSGNNSYVDMCMQTAASTYEWINIVQNNW